MKPQLIFYVLLATATSSFADPIYITVQCSGSPVREAARTTTAPGLNAQPFTIRTGIKTLANETTEPIRATVAPGNRVVLEMIREFRYPTVLAFTKTADAPIQPKEFVTKNTGMTVELTAAREGDQIIFHGTCTIRRPASLTVAMSTTPQNEPCVSSAAFITRECDFSGRAPAGTPAKINLGEQGIDTGELTLTFANTK